MEQVTLSQIKQFAVNSRQAVWDAAKAEGREPKIYWHWSAARYDQTFGDYTINVKGDGTIYVSTEDFSTLLSHTWGRNSGGIGIVACSAFGATANNLGDYPPTAKQIEVMVQVTVAVADGLWLTIDEQHAMTHGEAGDNEDGLPLDYSQLPDGDNGQYMGMYGPKHSCDRWDLEYLGIAATFCFGKGTQTCYEVADDYVKQPGEQLLAIDSISYNPQATDGSRGGDILRELCNLYRNQNAA